MNLVIDVGNTRTKAAFYDKALNGEIAYFSVLSPQTISNLLQNHLDIQSCILSSVGNYPKEIATFLKEAIPHVVLLDEKTPIPIKNRYRTPETLGKDRLAAAVAAQAHCPDRPKLIIDAGTCITVDFVDEKGNYWGGAISPGIQMRFSALHHGTAALPKVMLKHEIPVIGNDTTTAIQSGVLHGTLWELNGFVNFFLHKYSDLAVFVTGGDGIYFDTNLKIKTFAYPNMVLDGLNLILEFNENKN